MIRARWILIPSFALSALIACGGNGANETAGPALGGESGQAGEGGAAGEWGVGGEAGSAGQAGSAGEGSGGSAGESGAAGSAGMAGTSGAGGGDVDAGVEVDAGAGGSGAAGGVGGTSGSAGFGGAGGSGGVGGSGGFGGTSGSGGSGGSFTASGGTSGSGGSGGSFTAAGGTSGSGGSGGTTATLIPFAASITKNELEVFCTGGTGMLVGSYTAKYTNILYNASTAAAVTKSHVLLSKAGKKTMSYTFTATPGTSPSLSKGTSATVKHNHKFDSGVGTADPCGYCGGTMTLEVEWLLSNGETKSDTATPVVVTCNTVT
jgi:hypothetical protein